MNETFLTQHDDKELMVLRNISGRNKVRQRDLAAALGMSLGMTNAVVKRLVTKGLLTVRKVNNRNIMYAVSSEGMEEIAKKTYKYFKRTLKNIVCYKDNIDELVREVKDAGFSSVSLVGASDVDFIVEHFCAKYGIAYKSQKDEAAVPEESFILYGESSWEEDRTERRGPAAGRRTGELRDILARI